MKKITVVFYVLVSAITALEAVAAIYAISCGNSLWAVIAAGAVAGGVIAYLLGGKVFKDILEDNNEDYDE